ncbi:MULTISPECIES: 1,2-phenylacetyl-CoA epoxidase subunit PaaD [Exiguobacterium]|uniref:Phenylacetate-CoA oxygenase subunit PaaJ n=1 Tax=Exiguobacterium antarcticum TaxID=132920 RepID=A0ABT6R3P3_9BACL|nr:MULTISPECIES: 1,2-phenylacetyl-CoA epoxidase subunit PaaD [Exiguobacterium]MCT4779455.1 phenylacetate-CoA oxygenase subunit PaaJ [Exiguobacterium soli]MDI3235392.1 phenylacetate-CoA oxygenase subunit PaaJ [Exiguobacterium antarcticum]
MTILLEQEIRDALDTVKDPEIDAVSILDLGMFEAMEWTETAVGYDVRITLLPTFLGCPALEIIQKNTESALLQVPRVNTVKVVFLFDPPWTSDRITEQGIAGLKSFGIAPPRVVDGKWEIDCPYCGSTFVSIENLFGPTACRSILYCKSCKNPFEAMKPVSTLM